jgi:rhodanese-related sulfurtransferase
MKKTIQTILLFGMVFTFGMVQAEEKEVPQFLEGTHRITAEELIDLVNQKDDLVIIDARKRSDREKGFIEGSINLPDTETNPESLAKDIPSKSTPVVFYCNGIRCHRSVNAAKRAVTAGYTEIYWFRGGWGEWTEKGYPVAH